MDFKVKVLQLWREQKEKGVRISAPRHVGKTTALLIIANEEACAGNRVKIIARDERHRSFLASELDVLKLEHENIFVTYNGSMESVKISDVRLYDEINCGNLNKNELYIYTENPISQTFTFDKSWLNLQGVDLKKLKAEMGDNRFKNDFECNIISRDEE